MEASVSPGLRPRRLGIDTHQEPVVYMRADCSVCRSEGFEAHSRVDVRVGHRHILATLNVVRESWLAPNEAGFSDVAWRLLSPHRNDLAYFSHPAPVDSLSHVRAKIFDHPLSESQLHAIVTDIVAGRYSDVDLSAFITICGNDRLSRDEVISLTRAMVNTGNHLHWPQPMVLDKHCVGGLPGNRTTLIVTPILACLGLTMPKTSSRAITSPAGTADTMETLAPVALSLDEMRKVVELEGACIVWGGSMYLSPADDILIRIERALDLDSEGQLVASVLSKKIAAGSTHVVLDIPVGPTAKVRSKEEAEQLVATLRAVGQAMGIVAHPVLSDGTQPVGNGIGPALEAHDVLSVLMNEKDAPADLRRRGLALAAAGIELAGLDRGEAAFALAEDTLASGRAWSKFQDICNAQGGMRMPGRAPHSRSIEASGEGRVRAIDNRLLSRVAKLAGAPQAATAGVRLEVHVGDSVIRGKPLLTVHAETPGELEYALEFADRHPEMIQVEGGPS